MFQCAREPRMCPTRVLSLLADVQVPVVELSNGKIDGTVTASQPLRVPVNTPPTHPTRKSPLQAPLKSLHAACMSCQPGSQPCTSIAWHQSAACDGERTLHCICLPKQHVNDIVVPVILCGVESGTERDDYWVNCNVNGLQCH